MGLGRRICNYSDICVAIAIDLLPKKPFLHITHKIVGLYFLTALCYYIIFRVAVAGFTPVF